MADSLNTCSAAWVSAPVEGMAGVAGGRGYRGNATGERRVWQAAVGWQPIPRAAVVAGHCDLEDGFSAAGAQGREQLD